jgi:hypothetical protein
MDNGSKYRANVVAGEIVDNDAADHQKIKFLIRILDGKLEEIIAYNELSNVIEQQHEAEHHQPDITSWAFARKSLNIKYPSIRLTGSQLSNI